MNSDPKYTVLKNLLVKNATSNGIHLGIQMSGAEPIDFKLENVTSKSNGGDGVYLKNGEKVTFNHITSKNNGSNGIYVEDTVDSEFRNIVIKNNTDSGFYFTDSISSSQNFLIENIVASGSSNYYGIGIIGVEDGTIKNAHVSNNSEGSVISNTSKNITVKNSVFANNDDYGLKTDGQNHVLQNIAAFNNQGEGVQDDGINNSFSKVMSIGNGSVGIDFEVGNSTFLSGATVSFNGGRGAWIYNRDTISQVAFITNLDSNIRAESDSSTDTWLLSWIASINSGEYGVETNESNQSVVSDDLIVQDNDTKQCHMYNTPATPPFANDQCDPAGASTHTVVNGLDISGSFVGLISSENTNEDASHIASGDGQVSFSDITDWTHFDHLFRSWAQAHKTSYVPDNIGEVAGDCTSGETCGVWDWGLKNTDTHFRNKIPCPSGGNYFTHK